MMLGIVGGFAGGRLPGLLTSLGVSSHALEAKRLALLISSAIIALAVVPMFALRFPPESTVERNMYPSGKFITGFLVSLSIWSLATGAFNPFFNAYFSQRVHFSIERIGSVFSWAQLCQSGAVLLAPMVLRRCGQVAGIAAIQVATAVMLALLAPGFTGLAAAAIYVSYTSFQFMAAPTLYSMLMTRVSPAERGGASALNFLVASLTGALSAVVGGAMIARLGYSRVLLISALLAGLAAVLFRVLLRANQ
jgi:predicted MFS family arabinose efflux permease